MNALWDLHHMQLVKVTYPFFCYIKIEVGLPVAKVGIILTPKTSMIFNRPSYHFW